MKVSRQLETKPTCLSGTILLYLSFMKQHVAEGKVYSEVKFESWLLSLLECGLQLLRDRGNIRRNVLTLLCNMGNQLRTTEICIKRGPQRYQSPKKFNRSVSRTGL